VLSRNRLKGCVGSFYNLANKLQYLLIAGPYII
jgi:hypothetical protein